MHHIDIKIQRERQYISFVVVNNMKSIRQYIISRFPRLWFVKELQGVCEF